MSNIVHERTKVARPMESYVEHMKTGQRNSHVSKEWCDPSRTGEAKSSERKGNGSQAGVREVATAAACVTCGRCKAQTNVATVAKECAKRTEGVEDGGAFVSQISQGSAFASLSLFVRR